MLINAIYTHTNKYCKGISDYAGQWVRDYLNSPNKNQFLIVARERQPPYAFVGAAGCTIRSKVLYLNFICSGRPKLGTRMMTFIRRLARRLGKDGVELVSVPDRISFYKKQGYRRGPLGASKQNRAVAAKLFDATLRGTLDRSKLLSQHQDNVHHAYLNFAAQKPNAFGGQLFFNDNEMFDALPKYSRRVAKKKKPDNTSACSIM
ncbi:hypothetical protein EBT25_18320 [bacterium]|nr:hypothetical protein [bacterium]